MFHLLSLLLILLIFVFFDDATNENVLAAVVRDEIIFCHVRFDVSDNPPYTSVPFVLNNTDLMMLLLLISITLRPTLLVIQVVLVLLNILSLFLFSLHFWLAIFQLLSWGNTVRYLCFHAKRSLILDSY